GSGELDETQDGPVREMRWRGFRWWPRERHGTTAFTSAARRLFAEYVTKFGEPDVVHAHVVLPAGYAAYRIASNWGVPFVLTEHTGPFSLMTQTPWQRWQVRRATLSAAAVTAVSPALVAAMRSEGIEREIEVVPNTVAPEFLEPLPPRPRQARFTAIAAM